MSAETVTLMGVGAQERFGADIAVAVSGHRRTGWRNRREARGDGLVRRSRPVRRVGRPAATYPGDRETVRTRATVFALDLLRRQILGLPPPR